MPKARLYSVEFQYRRDVHAPAYETKTDVVWAYDAADALTQAEITFRRNWLEPAILSISPAEDEHG